MAAENCILDYKMQQYRLFKAMGASYMMLWTGRNIAQFMADVRQVHTIQNTSHKHTLSQRLFVVSRHDTPSLPLFGFVRILDA